ncbi:hypothetical protein HO133_000917 [Letharia lupina]|uniref:Uncharacterized protein n=1 Tax=Letharia lupina TaxID=560253 RepID=A0A8H6CGL1_9LECA|nr:uncharacterized protein HO133_000917 [Letharia lupina]KAF6222866.1 hypothetical protein HO133_000917 [Letharia lupina]
MAWTADTPGTFRKELGGLEKIYRFMSTAFKHTGQEHWGLYTVCAVDFGPILHSPAKALRDAWKALRFEFPALALTLDGYDAVYTLPTADIVEEWAQKTFIVEQNQQPDEIIVDYPLRDLPALYYLPATSEVLFLASHWRVDAAGCCLLLDRLFALVVQQPDIASLQWGPDLHKISPSLEDAAGSPEATSPEIEDMAQRVTSNFEQKAIRSIGLSYKGDRTTPPARPANRSIVLTPESSEALIKACKERQISVSAVIYAALAEIMFALTSIDGATEYSTIMAVNMRPYLKAPFNSPAHSVRTYVSSITPAVRRDSTFRERTVTLTQYFKTWHTNEFSQALREIYKRSSRALLTAPRPPGPPPNPPSGITLSSLGVIDHFLTGEYDGAVSVKRFRFGVSMLNRQMLLYLWTFRGQVHLSINYNDAYYDASTPQEVLDRIPATLETELGVRLETL